MHPRIVVHEVCFPAELSLDEEVSWWQRGHIERVGLSYLRRAGRGWLGDGQRVRDAGISIGYLLHERMFRLDEPGTWSASREALCTTVDAATALGVPLVYTTTGPAGSLEFEAATAALREAFAPVREHAAAAGVDILVHTGNPLLAHTHFFHTLADTESVAREVGLGICLDLYVSWWERGLRSTLRRIGDAVGLVQVSDFLPRPGPPGAHTFVREIPGDGILPLEKLIGAVIDDGYQGLFDVELYLRPAATALADTVRAVDWLTGVLDRRAA